MVSITPETNAALMAALVARIDAVGAGYCHVFGGSRPAASEAPAGVPICRIDFAQPCASIDPATGAMVLTPTDNEGANGQITNPAAPTWLRFYNGNGDVVMDLSARLVGDVNAGEEVVLSATTLNVGAFVRLAGGGFTAI